MSRQSVLVFEWLCGGGLFLDGTDPGLTNSLVRQGRQMLTAVCSDLHDAGVRPVLPLDVRLGGSITGQTIDISNVDHVRSCMASVATEVDKILVIAPETGGRLETCLQWLNGHSDKLLNPKLEFTKTCCNKNDLQAFLANEGIPVPRGFPASRRDELAKLDHNGFIVKPKEGAGGEGVRFLSHLDHAQPPTNEMRVEEFVPGIAVSVSVICNDGQIELLSPLRQQFDAYPVGTFVRCVDDLDTNVCRRAWQLAEKVVTALPKTNGYFGIDMVIGERDVVIEVNPRITMSYPVLREKLDFNLAELMLGLPVSGCTSSTRQRVDRQ